MIVILPYVHRWNATFVVPKELNENSFQQIINFVKKK